MTTLNLKESEISPDFNSGQRGILRRLATLIINALDATIAAIALDDLADVNAPSPVSGDYLKFDGTEWVAEDPFTPVTTVSSTSYTAVLTDANSFLKFTAATAVTFTIPPQASVAWRDSSQIEFIQYGAGQITVAAGSGVTIRKASAYTLKSREQYAVCGLKWVAENEWVLFGDLEQV